MSNTTPKYSTHDLLNASWVYAKRKGWNPSMVDGRTFDPKTQNNSFEAGAINGQTEFERIGDTTNALGMKVGQTRVKSIQLANNPATIASKPEQSQYPKEFQLEILWHELAHATLHNNQDVASRPIYQMAMIEGGWDSVNFLKEVEADNVAKAITQHFGLRWVADRGAEEMLNRSLPAVKAVQEITDGIEAIIAEHYAKLGEGVKANAANV